MTGVALVTGAGSGIGAAVARRLESDGWTVAGIDRRPGGDRCFVADVADAEAVTAAVARVERTVGPVDALVTAAGHYAITPLTEITAADWHAMLRVHLGGLANAARAVLPGMVERRRGRVIAVDSELGLAGGDQEAHYAAAKGAIVGLVRSLAVEAAPYGVGVNAVAPGPTDTPLLPADSPWRDPAYLATLPARRLATPEEVARCVTFLAGEADFCTGEVISPNSGAVI